eukprot:TRINITY_DN8520_c2_g1_i1.p1 TRINITY_DN8520_c2_g1~~TRINITY_DN8520_c2_g1_i1.p1  ORF type:complete len:1221 (+),score=465.64 TRINITY_DN8520_c2_g1_i1:107-3769(+)
MRLRALCLCLSAPVAVSGALDWSHTNRMLLEAHWNSTRIGTAMDICVQNDGGELKGFLRQDNAFLGSIDIACRKARTANYFQSTTGILGTLSQPGGDRWRVEYTNDGLISFDGGVKTSGSSSQSGAVGVSGSSVSNDHIVATAGGSLASGSAVPNNPSDPFDDVRYAAVTGLNSSWDMSLAQAKAVLDAALSKSIQLGTKMDVAVVDAHGNLKAFAREDAAWPASIDIAIRKAKSAAWFRQDSGTFESTSQPGQALWSIQHSNDGLSTTAGGVPIYYRGTFIGAVGVSGSVIANDVAVATAAAAAVAGHNPLPMFEITEANATTKLYAAIADAKARSVNMDIAVVDRGGALMTFARMDNAWMGSIDIALKKCKSSVSFRQNSSWLGTNSQPGGSLFMIEVSNGGLISFGGGVTLAWAGDHFGAIGVSGSTVANDHLVATAGLSASSGAYVDSAPNSGLLTAVTGLISTSDISLDQAIAAIEAARALATTRGANVDIAVVDRGGLLKAFHRQEGAAIGGIDIAIKKARTAVLFQMDSAQIGALSSPTGDLYMIEVSNGGLVSFGGGIVVLESGTSTVIGAVGVYGGSVADDVAIATAGSNAASAANNKYSLPIYDIGLTLATAKTNAAIAQSTTLGVAMDVAVHDNNGNLKYFTRMDNAWIGSIDIALKKARTARYFDQASANIGVSSQPGGDLYMIEVSNGGLISFGGGVTMTQSGNIYGTMGVSGSSVANDVTVANAGAAATTGTYTDTATAIGSQPTESGLHGVWDISLDQAVAIINAAVTRSNALGTKMNIAVYDRFGRMKAFAREDGAWLGSVDIAQKKARTAITMRESTLSLASKTRPGGSLYMAELTNGGMICFAGGIPLTYNGQMIGSIGVSGSSVANDQDVATNGAAALSTKNPVGSYDVSLGRAQFLINNAISQSRTLSQLTSVAVADAGGNLKAFARMDGAIYGSIDLAIRRAVTAKLFDLTTETVGTASQPGGTLYQIEVSNDGLATGRGGLPLQANNSAYYGGLGVAGSTVDLDLQIATAASTANERWAAGFGWDNSSISAADVSTDISLDMAMKIIDASIQSATGMYQGYSIAVVDTYGHLKAFFRSDDSPLAGVDIAVRAAKTARGFGVKSADIGVQSQPGGHLWRTEHSNDGLVTFAGGLPLAICGNTIGGIGVFGLSSTSLNNIVAAAGANALTRCAATSPSARAAGTAAAITAAAAAALFTQL